MTKAKDLLQFAGSCDDLDIDKSQKDWKTMNNPFLDDRPLTDETLKELGFVQKENRDWTNGKTVLGIWEGEVVVNIAISPTFTTVGKLKMLLEALKGE